MKWRSLSLQKKVEMRIFLNGTYQPWNWGLRGTCPDLAQLCSSPFNICSSKAPDDLCCFSWWWRFLLVLFSEFLEHFFPFHPPSHQPLSSNSLSLWPFFLLRWEKPRAWRRRKLGWEKHNHHHHNHNSPSNHNHHSYYHDNNYHRFKFLFKWVYFQNWRISRLKNLNCFSIKIGKVVH